jgi:hypothetical protein
MRKEIEVKNTDTEMNPHWDGKITLTKEWKIGDKVGNEPLMMEQTNAITVVEAKELDSASFMGAEVKTEYLGVAVVALLAIIIGFRYCTKTLTKGK